MINHDINILVFPQPTDRLFRDIIRYFGLVGLCSSTCLTINHDIHEVFVERWF